MREIQHFGAAGEVTGTRTLLTDNNNGQILVDMGSFQGSIRQEQRNYEPLPFDPTTLDGIVITHGHLDHVGGLGRLPSLGYKGEIFMTAPTKDLARLVLEDSVNIMYRNRRQGLEPLFHKPDVEEVMSMVKTVPFDREFSVGNFSGVFKESGHILGSASVKLKERNTPHPETIVFSGDIGDNNPEDIVKNKKYIDKADIVVMETTYGDKDHGAEDPRGQLQEEVEIIQRTGGVLLIPAFSIHRTQRLLHMLGEMQRDSQIAHKTKIILDSKMGKRATDIYNRYPHLLRDDLKKGKSGSFSISNLLIPGMGINSQDISRLRGPKIIIAGSGMMNGGKIREHAMNYLSRSNTRLLLTGYQSEGSLGRQLQEGAKIVEIDGYDVDVRATVSTLGSLSAHAGQSELFNWVNTIDGVRKVVLVHGDTKQREVFSYKTAQEMGVIPDMPRHGDRIDLTRPHDAFRHFARS